MISVPLVTLLIISCKMISFFFPIYVDVASFIGAAKNASSSQMLYDHRPLKLNNDDYQRVCHIPKKKVSLPCLLLLHRNEFIHLGIF